MVKVEKIHIFENDKEIFLAEIDGLLLDTIILYLQDKINFEIVYNNNIKIEILETVFYNIKKIYKKLTPETLKNIRIYLDKIYYKITKKGVEIAKKQFEAEANAHFEKLARAEIEKRKQEEAEKQKENTKKSLWRRFWET